MKAAPFSLAATAAAVLTVLAGCAADGPPPQWDSRFGDAVRGANVQQRIVPDASARNAGGRTTADGRATREAHDRYVDSYAAPPPSNVISIGVSGGK